MSLPLITSVINGKPRPSDGDELSPVFNPATGEIQAQVSVATAAQTSAAVEAAHDGFAAWAAVPSLKRAKIFFRWRELLEQSKEELANAVSAEHGKVLDDARGEITRGIEVVEFLCGLPHITRQGHSNNAGTGIDTFELRQPLGVTAAITPFNFPFMVPMWMAPVSLACGNCCVLKPSEKTPSASLILHRLALEAGIPGSAFQVVQGGREAVNTLLNHPKIAAVSFVGATQTAMHIYATAAKNGKRVQALGGAKNHMVILPDANIERAADALIGAAYGSAGERCMAISVAVPVGEETAERLVAALVPRVRGLKLGPATDPDAEMGPLITAQHRDSVVAAIEAGVAQGGELKVDGRDVSLQGYEGGFFLGGTLFDHVSTEMDLWRDEIFGPVLSVVRASDASQALEVVNQHRYGNGTALFTRDGEAARRFIQGVEAGMVGINVPLPVPVAWHSFGGWKQSLFGAHAIYGEEGIHFNSRLKTVTARWPQDDDEHHTAFHFPTLA